MKKLFLILFVALNQQSPLAGMQTNSTGHIPNQVTISFDIPPLLMRLVDYAAQQYFKLGQISFLVAMSPALPYFALTHLTPRKDFDRQLSQRLKYPLDQSVTHVFLLIFHTSFNGTIFSLKKAAVLHEFQHVYQYYAELNGKMSFDIEHYQNEEQEADVQAILHLNCYRCAREYATSRPTDPASPYLSPTQAYALAQTLDHSLLCDFHRNYCAIIGESPTDPDTWETKRALPAIEKQVADGTLEP